MDFATQLKLWCETPLGEPFSPTVCTECGLERRGGLHHWDEPRDPVAGRVPVVRCVLARADRGSAALRQGVRTEASGWLINDIGPRRRFGQCTTPDQLPYDERVVDSRIVSQGHQ